VRESQNRSLYRWQYNPDSRVSNQLVRATPTAGLRGISLPHENRILLELSGF